MLLDCISFNEGTTETCRSLRSCDNGSMVIKMSHLLAFTAAAIISLILIL